MNPRVTKVTASNDYKLSLLFTKGERGVFDCYDLLEFGVFKELKNKAYFSQAEVIDEPVTDK